jgi:hypothetical protein
MMRVRMMMEKPIQSNQGAKSDGKRITDTARIVKMRL